MVDQDLARRIALANKCISFLPLVILVVGIFGNTLCFITFRFDRTLSKLSAMVYLSFVVVLDTMSLFIWNINSFTRPNWIISMELFNLATCRILVFIQYFSLQSSAFLLSFVSIDRFVTIIASPGSRISKLPFGTKKSALIWSITVVATIALLNLHIVILNGYYIPSKRYNVSSLNETNWYLVSNISDKLVCYVYSTGFTLDTWEMVHLFVASLVPFIIMLLFNSIVIIKLIRQQKSASKKSITKRNHLTIALLTITFVFIILVLPKAIYWGFLDKQMIGSPYKKIIVDVFNFFLFTNQSAMFVICFITYPRFRSSSMSYLSHLCCCCRRTIPENRAAAGTVNTTHNTFSFA